MLMRSLRWRFSFRLQGGTHSGQPCSFTQMRLCRILRDVSPPVEKFLLIPYDAIPRFLLPESARAPETLVRLPRGKAAPGVVQAGGRGVRKGRAGSQESDGNSRPDMLVNPYPPGSHGPAAPSRHHPRNPQNTPWSGGPPMLRRWLRHVRPAPANGRRARRPTLERLEDRVQPLVRLRSASRAQDGDHFERREWGRRHGGTRRERPPTLAAGAS